MQTAFPDFRVSKTWVCFPKSCVYRQSLWDSKSRYYTGATVLNIHGCTSPAHTRKAGLSLDHHLREVKHPPTANSKHSLHKRIKKEQCYTCLALFPAGKSWPGKLD